MGFRETFCRMTEARGTISEISRATGIDTGLLCRYKSDVVPSLDNAVLIADFFNVSLDYLAGRTPDPVMHDPGDRTAMIVTRSYDMMGPAGRQTLATVAKSMAMDPANRVQKSGGEYPQDRNAAGA